MEKELNYLSDKTEEVDHKIGLCRMAMDLGLDNQEDMDRLIEEKQLLENILSALTIVELNISKLPVVKMIGGTYKQDWKSDIDADITELNKTNEQVVNDWCRYELFDGITDQEIANLIRERAAIC